jgi:hypothetical protein
MRNLIRILRDAEPEEQGGGAVDFQENIQNSVERELNELNKPVDEKDTAVEGEKPSAENNPAPEKKAEEIAEELHDMEVTDKEGKPVKWGMKQIKQLVKFYFDNADTIGGGIKLRQAAEKHPEFKQLMEKILTGTFDDKDNFNKDFAINTLKSFEAKKEAIEEKIDDKTDEIKEAEAALEDLDPDSPQAKIMRTTIASLKRARADHAGVLKQLKDYQKEMGGRVEGLENKHKDAQTAQEKAVYDEEVKRVASIFDAELGTLLDSNKPGNIEFADAEEKAEFEGLLRNMVANNAAEINKLPPEKQDEAFKKSIGTFGKAIFEKMSRRREHWNIQYAKKKGWVKPEKQEEKKSDEKGDMTREGLEKTIEDLLGAET